MKSIFALTTFILALISCNNSAKPASTMVEKDVLKAQKFFPVTSYIKGEIYNIKQSHINPLLYTTVNNHTDSVWLKADEIDAAVQEFLSPEIDSINLIMLFTEKSFLDQSINAVTFTYDAAVALPDTMKLKHWDVYVDPDANTVKRIYMVKEISKTKTLQLTWVNNEWCKITTIVTDEKGISKVEMEKKLIWNF